MNTDKILLDVIACVSILCCAVYIVVFAKKTLQNRFHPLKGMFLSKKPIVISYDGNNINALLHFYTDGLIFERENNKKLYVRELNIVRLLVSKKDDKFIYNMEFDPEVSENDSFDIISDEEITEDFIKIVDPKKLNIDL